MSDDASPENLRKFLESDDSAMVMMGLSMAKGSGVPEELLPTILGLYMWDDDSTVRAAAKSVFTKYAPAELQAKVKENWKSIYRTLSITGNKFPEAIRQFIEAFKSQDDFAEIALESLIKALEDDNRGVAEASASALGKIGDVRAVEPLIKALGDENRSVRSSAAFALGVIGDARAVEPLIKTLDNEAVAWALGHIGKPAVEPLIKALEDDNGWIRSSAAEVLGVIGDARAVEPLIRVLGGEKAAWMRDLEFIRKSAIEALGEIGDVRAVEMLIEALGDGGSHVRESATSALGKIGDARAVEPLSKALGDETGYVRWPAAEALGVIGDARAVEPLIEVLLDDDWRVRRHAAEALGKIGDARAVEPLNKVLKDEKEHVRKYAKEALKKLSGGIMADTDKIHYEMTGSPKRAGFKSKAELTEYLAEHGYVRDDLAGEGYGQSPDKVCDLLLTNSYDSSSSKMKKAKKRGIRILTFQDLIKELE
jgi:HEAT repeat protein